MGSRAMARLGCNPMICRRYLLLSVLSIAFAYPVCLVLMSSGPVRRTATHSQADWGLMVWEGAPNILTQWWIAVVPGCAMFILVTAFNIFGDRLKEVLGTTQKR